MDLSALIFVALAVAWAVYLVPKALKHHDEVVRSRSVDRFSHRMRVLARREPVSRRDARLVVTPGRAPSGTTVSTKARPERPVSVTPLAVRREAARRAARRRRRVLFLVILANAVVIGLAVGKLVVWPWVAAPATMLVAWLVACRLMVKSERAAARSAARGLRAQAVPDVEARIPVEDQPEVVDEPAAVEEPVVAAAAAPGAWDMVPTTLPTYVTKPAATRRTVQTIDLESTGVWTSGRIEGDSALAREAEQSERAARDAAAAQRRASGS
ncbi:hypothetical protein [Nocardioides gansuensis]|uniref:divisome protein SepX/GlpR n=1 Tax=Nocardioides gansuensis TaxID=2138300 RepID=UPI0014037648|nr:hypothetical protein [Nocardioides gansuensis]